jgi:hypothetical protein
MGEFLDLERRIDRLCTRASAGVATKQLMQDIEDTLAEGFLMTLNGDSRRRQIDERLRARDIAPYGGAENLEDLHLGWVALDRDLTRLRSRLSELRQHFIRLGGTRLPSG